MSYPKNAASPPPIFATVVKAADGTPITSGVAAKYSIGAHQGAGGGTLHSEDNGQWSYIPTQAETNVSGFGIQFYHADAVGTGPTISVVTDTLAATLGTPANIDTGGATIADNLKKIADDNGGASFDATTHSLAKLSAAIVTGTPSQIYASANTLERGTARQATTPWATGGVASTFADTVATDLAYLACSPVNSTATVNGIANVTMWQTMTFLAGTARVNYVSTVGYFSGGTSPRVCDAYYYDYVSATWKLLTSTANRMNNAAADATYGPWYLPAAAQKNQTAGDGEVKIAFVSSGTNVNDILHANLVFLSASIAGPSASDVADAVYNRMLPVTVDGVWLDTVNGVDGGEGFASSPLLTIAGAYARCAALNLKRIYFKAGSNAVAVALTQSADGWRFVGPGVIDIAGQSIADAVFEDCYTISNTGAAVGDDAKFYNCGMSNGPFRHGYWWHCQLKNATGITLTAGDEYHFFSCKDATPEAGDPATFIFAAGADLNLRDYQGGVQIKSMATGDTAKLDGALRLVVHSSSTGGAITLRGNGPVPTIASQFTAGGGTVNDDALYNVQAVNAEADTALSDYGPNTVEPDPAGTAATLIGALNDFDPTTDTVLLATAQGGVEFSGQVKITADADGEGALHIVNTHTDAGTGVHAEGYDAGLQTDGDVYGQHNVGGSVGAYNDGANYGEYNKGDGLVGQFNASASGYGQLNVGTSLVGQYNHGAVYGQLNEGDTAAVFPTVAGLTDQQTADAVYNLAPAGSPAAGSAGAQLTAILEDTGTTLPATLNALPAAIEAYLSTYHGAGIYDGSTALVNTYAITFYTPDTTGHPVADCLLWVTTDLDGTNIIQKGITDDFGNVTVFLQVGTYYIWRRKAQMPFSNPNTYTMVAP